MTKRSRAPRQVFVVVAVIIIASTTVTYWYGHTVINAHQLTSSRHAAIAQLQRVLSAVKDAETGQRGFIITGDESYLTPYHDAVAHLPLALHDVQSAPVLESFGAQVSTITQLVERKLEELNATINLRRTGGFDAAAAIVATGRGRQTMEELRGAVADLQTQQEQLLARDAASADVLTHRRTALFVGTALVSLLFLYWASHRIGAVLRAREAARREAEEQRLEAQRQREVAETANRAKDHFLAMLSHELRTPLTPVLSTLSMWETSDDLPPELQQDVHMLRRSVELEARIIDDLLDLTRIARGILSFSPETTDVHELIALIVSLSQSAVYDKQQRLTLELNAERHFVHTDASRLQQVLWNIVRNAVKFTERKGSITINTSNDAENNIVVRVTDTGVGMTREKLDGLFVPFDTSGRAGADTYGGLGLGLAISRALVDLLHGRIEAHSDGPDLGSTFTVTFPTVETPAGKTADAPPTRPDRQLRILIVEDHADTARALARLLSKRGYEVDTADSVASAIVKVEQNTFDLLLCDIGLPDGTGFDLIEHVRKTSDTPALALSGFGTTQDVNRSKQAGFEAHLTKPVNFQKLEATICQLTSARS